MSYRDLQVWQKAMELVQLIYQITQSFPADERFGLVSQMQRAAVSVPSNIAEGQGRKSAGAFANHLWVAHGSLLELETQIQIAEQLGYVMSEPSMQLQTLTAQIGRMLHGLAQSVATADRQPPTVDLS